LTPNRIWRDLGPQSWPLGRSDYSGVENLMDNLDEVYSSWMRDVRLAKSRIIVPPEYLDTLGRGKGAVWDPERHVYTTLRMLHDEGGPNNGITLNQFAIRWEEHQQTCQDLVNRIVQEAGYSPQTFGDYQGNAPTATEIHSRERTSMMTRSKKINYWRPGLQDIIYGLMTIEAAYFGNKAITPERPDIEFIETIAPDMLTLAQTAQTLDAAAAASRQTLVQLVHPDWTTEQVDEEVDRIIAETGEQMAAHARIALSAPMGEPLSQEIGELAAIDQVPPVTDSAPTDASTDVTS
jgi:A118 family predicted phage portal protein